MKRYLEKTIREDLNEKMVFLGGPRQVGKTTLAMKLLNENKKGYLSWDSRSDRKMLLEEKLPLEEKLLVLDEIHKYKHWRNLVKGFYDKYEGEFSFLITGSARLDYYRRGGDSLQGRYHYHRLHPLSLGELLFFSDEHKKMLPPLIVNTLLEYGGFPEPFFKANKRHWRRWQNERSSRVFNEDLQNLELVHDVDQLKLMAELLPEKVGSPLSIKSISDDLNINHATATRWLKIMNNLYYIFLIPPYGSKKIKAVKKEQKLYLWDWSLCESPGAKFENLVASQLLKYCHHLEDTEGHKMDLRYIRDTNQREVDFVVLKDSKPEFAVEVKLSDHNIAPNIHYFRERTDIPQFYQVHLSEKEYKHENISVLNFSTFVKMLKMP